MTLGLDLSPSRTKLQRAADHARSLNRQAAIVRDRQPFSVRVSEVDRNTGWCDVFFGWHEIKEPSLSTIAGDYINNLREALNYVVTVLAEASGVELYRTHAFPIHLSRTVYKKEVGTQTRARHTGPLRGVKHGLALIEQSQPYHNQPNPESHPLATLAQFSNTNKHRRPIQAVVFFAEGYRPNLSARFVGDCVESWQCPEIRLSLNDETKVASFRFAQPYPPQVNVEADIEGELMVAAPPFPPKEPQGKMVTMGRLGDLYACVATVVQQAEAL